MSVARLYKVATPFNAVELADMDYAQSFDVVYLAHLNHEPTKVVRSAHTDWDFSTIDFEPTIEAPTGVNAVHSHPNVDDENDGNSYFPQPDHYAVTAINDETGQESRASASDSATNDLTLKRNKNTITWNAVSGADRYRVYKAHNERDYGWIGDVEGLQIIDDNISADLTDAPPEAYNPFTLLGNPSSVAFFEQRLIWGRLAEAPNAIVMSRSADFENMDTSRPARADDSVVIRIAAQKVNAVNSLVPMVNLLAMTSDSIMLIQGSNDDFISANPPPRAVRQSGRGASRLKPIVVDEVVFYQPDIASEVRSLGFTFEIDGYRSNDVSIFSPGFFRGYGINAWAYAEEPLSVIWTIRNDGKMPAFTWQQEQQVWGWTLCETDGVIEDAVSIQEGDESRTYLIVQRTIDGVEKRFVERIASPNYDDQKLACYLDCAMTWVLEEPRQVFRIPHLANSTVSALADGAVIHDLEADAQGDVDIGFEAESYVTIGLPFEALVETMPLMMETQEGRPANKRQMLGKATVQVVDTRLGGLEAGPSIDRLYPFKERGTEVLGEPPELFTGKETANMAPVGSGEATLILRHGDPTPFTLAAVYLDPIVTEN